MKQSLIPRLRQASAIMLLAMCLLIAGCATNTDPAEKITATNITAEDWTPTLTVEESRPEGATILFRQTNELEDCIVLSGNDYILQRYDDGVWEDLPTLTDEVNFITNAFVVTAIPREEVDWQWLYGALPSGRYRIGKQVALHCNTQTAATSTVYGEFTIETSAHAASPAGSDSASLEAAFNPTEETVKKESQEPTTAYTFQPEPPSYTYSPLASLPSDYSRDDAENDHVVVLLDGNAVANQDVWAAFVTRASQGISGSVRCLDQDSRTGTQRIYDVSYDGTFYAMRRIENGSEKTELFKQLLHFEDDKYSIHAPSHRYVLTMESGITWDDIQWSMVNRNPNDGIAHQVVYQALSYHPVNPPIPDSSRVELSLRGKPLITVSDAEARQLTELFSKAEALQQRPEMNYTALDLVFYGKDGSQVTVWLNLYGDSFLCDGTFYQYSTDAMFKILDIETWPEEVLFAFPE